MRAIFFLIVISSLTLAIGRLDRIFFKRNASFSPYVIQKTFAREALWDFPLNSPSKNALNQKYFFFSKGKQSFVFVSEDGETVLKFLRFPKHLKKPLPKHIRATLNSFQLTLSDLSGESQLICGHVNPTHQLFGVVTLVDPLGRNHLIDLDKTPFLLQKKGELFFNVFDQLVDHPKKVRLAIDNTLYFFQKCWQKNLIDQDVILDKNYGMEGLVPFIIDCGQWERFSDPIPLDLYLQKATNSLQQKLSREAPELQTYLQDRIKFHLKNSAHGL